MCTKKQQHYAETVVTAEELYLASAEPCPFCGSTDLSTTDWAGDDGEYTAIACNTCLAEAPADAWNNRVAQARLADEKKNIFKENVTGCVNKEGRGYGS